MKDNKITAASNKPDMSIIPMRCLIGAARVFTYGAAKYSEGNFLLATLEDNPERRYVSALLRHFSATQGLDGKIDMTALDSESGLPHIDHMICGLIMLRGILTKEGVLPEDPGQHVGVARPPGGLAGIVRGVLAPELVFGSIPSYASITYGYGYGYGSGSGYGYGSGYGRGDGRGEEEDIVC